MEPKALEHGSEYAKFDRNGDGIVTDEELAVMKEMSEIERADRKQKQQRYMSWTAIGGMVSYPILIMIAELAGLDNSAKILGDMAPTYFIAAAGIAGAFMGFAAMDKMGTKKST